MRWTWRQKSRNTTKVWQMRSDMPNLPCITGICAHPRPLQLRLNVCKWPNPCSSALPRCVFRKPVSPWTWPPSQRGWSWGKHPVHRAWRWHLWHCKEATDPENCREMGHTVRHDLLSVSYTVTLLWQKTGIRDEKVQKQNCWHHYSFCQTPTCSTTHLFNCMVSQLFLKGAL